jgi:hypothetical protein
VPKAIVITHAGCPDGHCSAYMLDHHLRPSHAVEHHPVGYDHPMFKADVNLEYRLEWLSGAAVYIADFCPPADWLVRASNYAESILVLDHHETAAKTIVPQLAAHPGQPFEIHDSIDSWEMGPSSKFEIVVDMNRSGAGLVAQWLGINGIMAHEIFPHWREVEDRDLWRYSIDGSEAVCAAIAARPLTFEAWDELASIDRDILRALGEPVLTYKRQLVDSVTANPFGLRLDKADLTVPCCTAPYMIGSDAAGRLAEQDEGGIGAYIIVHGTDVQVGIRSRGGGPNCREIAELYGGGGHPGAAGFRLPHQALEAMITSSIDPAVAGVGG